MPIIYPERCRNITAGALRQAKQKGYTTASGGLFSSQYIYGIVGTRTEASLYFSYLEPGGKFMEALEGTKKLIEENTNAILSAGHRLVDSAKDANKQMAEVTGKMREGTDRLGAAIDKLMKVAGRGDFAETVKLTESLVSSLERLAVLEERGMLDKVMSAMRG